MRVTKYLMYSLMASFNSVNLISAFCSNLSYLLMKSILSKIVISARILPEHFGAALLPSRVCFLSLSMLSLDSLENK